MDTTYKALKTSAEIQISGKLFSEEQWNSLNRLLFVLDKLNLSNFRDARIFVRSVLDANPEYREKLLAASAKEMKKVQQP